MTFEKAVKLLREEYDKAVTNSYIKKPLAYALYRVWKLADKEN